MYVQRKPKIFYCFCFYYAMVTPTDFYVDFSLLDLHLKQVHLLLYQVEIKCRQDPERPRRGSLGGGFCDMPRKHVQQDPRRHRQGSLGYAEQVEQKQQSIRLIATWYYAITEKA